MMWDIVLRASTDDDFVPSRRDGYQLHHFTVEGSVVEERIAAKLNDVFEKYRCRPSSLALDLLNVALATYAADQAIPRKQGFQQWQRGLNLYIPVTDSERWQLSAPHLQQMLHFLSDDHWRFRFRPNGAETEESAFQSSLLNSAEAVALLSGGLDSFIGAIDLLEGVEGKVAFVSHYKKDGQAKPIQDRLLKMLARQYPSRVNPFQFYVQAPKPNQSRESSSRTRSFLFLALAVATASARGARHVYISENGYMSLNVPMTHGRNGSHSTRTTHPHFLASFQQLLDAVGLQVQIKNPYRFKTKGEMILDCSNPVLLRDGISQTHSCGRSQIVRYARESRHAHCGFCLPCFIRNAATKGADVPDVSYLRTDPIRKAQRHDIWAFGRLMDKYAAGRLDSAEQVAKSGPIPNDLQQYISVYERGLAELALLTPIHP